MFIDEVKIKVISGKWGDGLVSWRREKYIPKGGPWGWDGGKWGDVYLQTDQNFNTLWEYRNKKVLKAEKWEWWGTNTKHGANAPDLILKVPVWTLVTDANTGELLADLSENHTKLLVAKWGRGGYGNAHFCSSIRQAPAFAEFWDVAEERDLQLELKLVADIGIIGIPSAGKSTLISKLTSVKPKIGDYPFTTLTPNLGVLEYKGKSLVLEDVPGLIPGASEWKGLGIEFLKHIERTGVLLHLLDLYRLDNIFSDYENIRKELEYFSDTLAQKEEIIILSKADLLDAEMLEHIQEEFSKKYPDKKIFTISSATGKGIEELQDFLIDEYAKGVREEKEQEIDMKVYDLREESMDPKKSTLKYLGDFLFEIQWARIEQIVRMTDFSNLEAIARVYDVLEKIGMMKKIEDQLSKVTEDMDIDNSSFFEGSEEETLSPRVQIAGVTIPLDRLKYSL